MQRLLVKATSTGRHREQPVTRQAQIRLAPHQVTALAAAYRDGKTIKELAQLYGVHRTTVSALLRRSDVRQRPRGLVAAELGGQHSCIRRAGRWRGWANATALTAPRSGAVCEQQGWPCAPLLGASARSLAGAVSGNKNYYIIVGYALYQVVAAGTPRGYRCHISYREQVHHGSRCDQVDTRSEIRPYPPPICIELVVQQSLRFR